MMAAELRPPGTILAYDTDGARSWIMAENELKWEDGDPGSRIDRLDREDLEVEDLEDIEEEIEERIEAYERQSEALSSDLLDEKMTGAERKRNLTEKERIAEALEKLEIQKQVVSDRLKALEGVGMREND
jgi:hypothetical protein